MAMVAAQRMRQLQQGQIGTIEEIVKERMGNNLRQRDAFAAFNGKAVAPSARVDVAGISIGDAVGHGQRP